MDGARGVLRRLGASAMHGAGEISLRLDVLSIECFFFYECLPEKFCFLFRLLRPAQSRSAL